LLRRTRGQPAGHLPAELSFAGVTIDFVRFHATRAGVPVHLTVKEFALLQHLAAERGCAVRRDALVDRVWGEDVNVTHRTVDTHVLALRQKLEPEPSNPRHILTVHGVGYRFVAEA
jgi:DNA-binding response OmpR family regulator